MSKKRCYVASCCFNKARELQHTENLRQQGIRADMIAGLERLAGIPERFKDARLENFRPDLLNGEAITACLDLTNRFDELEKEGRGLVLFGGLGVGKTHLLVGTLRRLISRGVASRYIYSPDLLGLLRDRSKEGSILDITFRDLCSERVIALDDIGVDRDTSWTIAQYTRIIDGRHRTKRVTLCATNLGMEDFANVVGPRAMSRIVECSDILEVKGPDRRIE